ncbi:MAG: DNA integrity scanning protein DisA nucleotide-binding domain protein [Labilithrix sp.]|nr:DNA integrity scanning protein DisA nucleotide-binding domain protein [Labilithrix sp.]
MGLSVDLREMATRALERARRPMPIDVAFVRIEPPKRGRRVVGVEPPEATLTADAFDSLSVDPALPWPEALHDSIQDRLDARDREQHLRSFAGQPARVGDFDIVPVIRFDGETFDAQASLRKPIVEDGYVRCRSLLEGVAWTLLLDATRALGGGAAGAGGAPSYEPISRDPEDVLRTAGRLMMVTAGHAAGHPQGLIGLFDEVNEIASLRYEGREPSGSVVVARLHHPSITRELVFKHPVPLEQAAWARKVLELSSGSSRLLTDSFRIHGLGGVSPDYDTAREDLFVIELAGHQRWELVHAGSTLMRVVFGIPTLPEEPLDVAEFRDALRAEFGDQPESAVAAIWAVVRRALGQKTGALVVVAENAEAEGMRLSNQGAPIVPTAVGDDTVDRVTAIDGAVLLDTKGLCHAVGVILDGRARAQVGSPARGARYNSAARYVDAAEKPALAVVVSEDGTVDVVRRGAAKRRAA